MVKQAITKRYYFTYKELQKILGFDEGEDIETVEATTQYQRDEDTNLKDIDVVLTTVKFEEPEDDEKEKYTKHK